MNSSPDSAFPNGVPDRLPETPSGASLVIPVISESAVVTRKVVESGRVRVTKSVHEKQELVNLALQHEEVRVERVPVNQFVDEAAPPTTRYEGNTMIIPVLREVMVKRLVLVEELHVAKVQVTTQHSQPVVLRHEEVHVNRRPAEGAAQPPVVFPGSPAPGPNP